MGKQVRLKVTSVGILTPKWLVKAMAFIDNGLDTTLITKDFAVKNHITTQPSSSTISTVNGIKTTSADRTSVTLMSLDSGERVEMTEAFTIAELPMRAVKSIGEPATRWTHLRDLHFEEADSSKIDLLIGSDMPEAYWVLDQRLDGREEPYTARTVFGRTLFGSHHSANRKPLSNNFTNTIVGDDVIEQTLQRMYDNEFDELSDQKRAPSVEDNRALAKVETGTRYQPDGFKVPLPWKPGYALKRLGYLKRRLVRDTGLCRQFTSAMQWKEHLGYTERVVVSQPRG
ncbi:unnamed protein product [Echinostoma caproni]|uniref:Peptidase A2 domain-containing protein n=1 Tax=Echinostoma caproni TaxID=27848 RepID=A0A183B6I5_9TREM|nr:unnamed protein product [Echinostoma caproni]